MKTYLLNYKTTGYYNKQLIKFSLLTQALGDDRRNQPVCSRGDSIISELGQQACL